MTGRISILFLTAGIYFAISSLSAEEKNHLTSSQRRVQKTATNDDYQPMLINNIFNYYSNNGDGSFNRYSASNEGFEFPKGSNDGTVVFEDGVVWSGYHNGVLKVGGSTYSHGLQAGKILAPGTATSAPTLVNPTNSKYRLYRVRPDITPANTFTEVQSKVQEESNLISRGYAHAVSAQEIYNQYIKDWNEWPADDGAPYTDVNHDGIYEPSVDIPGFPGADQTMWHVSNDVDSTRTKNLYYSDPIGIEEQRTIWAYNNPSALGNTIFVQTKIINKSGLPIESMFIAQWADPDLGDAGDDYAGCDTVLNLGFVYNSRMTDANYARLNLPPPAVGFDLLQGPIVPSTSTDSAMFDGKLIHGYKNLPMTAFSYVFKSGIADGDPPLFDPRGIKYWYNYMRGLHGNTGEKWINPITGLSTPYVFSGDPVMGTGWNDGTGGVYAADRRIAPCSGPFTMAPGDTQEIITATLAAQGADQLTSVTLLKYYTTTIQMAYNNHFIIAKAPPPPVVHATGLNNEIVLNWSDNISSSQTESYNKAGYKFQGYNVYQATDSSFNKAQRIATYDIVDGVRRIRGYKIDPAYGGFMEAIVQFGSDNGIQRFFETKKDFFTNLRLRNGQPYYYAVTAYTYNYSPFSFQNNYEDTLAFIAVTPQTPKPGTILHTHFGELLNSTRIIKSGINNGDVFVRVIDPTILTGHNYTITFSGNGQNKTWNIKDSTLGKILQSDISEYLLVRNETDDPAAPIADGLQFIVRDPDFAGGSGPILNRDSWTITTTGLGAIEGDIQQAKADVDKINVFPNPYFGTNAQESSQYDKFVTFSHLPRKAIIRIYTLDGVLVTTLMKDDDSQFLRWYLVNNDNVFLASGMYLAYIEMPDLGKKKMLKIAVIIRVIVPEHY